MVLGEVATDLLLVDIDLELRDAQVHDLCDAAYCCGSKTRVRAATYKEAAECDIIVVTAGSKWTVGETSINFMYRNISIVRNVMDALRPISPRAILIVVSNPVDTLTTIAQGLSGLPTSQVIGSGTFLDSARLRGVVADKTGVAVDSVQLSVLGVHGPAQVSEWSAAKINDIPLEKALSDGGAQLSRDSVLNREELEYECQRQSEAVIRTKGSVPFGVGAVVLRLCATILADRGDICTVSHYHQEFDCYFSLPVVLGRNGILRNIYLPLNQDELERVRKSAHQLRKMVVRIKQEA
ncbi:lactate dehydrogenase/glycoside hydrolase [Microdochium trichocladiopsis]|uniref:Lactate dehydrogenase/glycoside hydrolase n=1 Tax=Microdochium trichocladiopsis TaxID=1682393 RepID=A0A9P8XYF4_9PEZI|nr:lactate dehydrogenase/glycoside hydrolase [Microdochium trichocladiopsis]KAH7024860.1 lactate dehydrogenase/glycoside hydrolase [Microdochium trichocladiopsis]